MCGIAGFIGNLGNYNYDDACRLLAEALKKRGPDSTGVFTYENATIVHTRLSIIDLENGQQPMKSHDGKLIIVFNGEIYNYKKLKGEIEREGAKFQTTSDTEVILWAVELWGIDKALDKIEGMFSFALVDKVRGELFLARDRFGEKPLYCYSTDDYFMFASELKALEPFLQQKEIDKHALNLYLSLTYIPAPLSIYKNVTKMIPGTYQIVPLSNHNERKEYIYYDLLARVNKSEKLVDFGQAKSELRYLLSSSVKDRMVSDVPIGAFLSGGIDSSIVATLMAEHSKEPINTFSIGFVEKEYDESKRAQLVSERINSNHSVEFLDYKDVIDNIDETLAYFDEPFGDSSCIPANFVAKLAAKKVKVVLTGDAADELFGGYEKYLVHYYLDRLSSLPGFVKKFVSRLVGAVPHNKLTNSFLRRAKKVLSSLEMSPFERHLNLMYLGLTDKERRDLLSETNYLPITNFVSSRYLAHRKGNEQEKGFYADLTIVLEGDMLTKVDRVCMKNSLEGRVPFLDSKLVEFAYKLPLDFKIKKSKKKFILKQAFRDALPKRTLRFRKKGFGVPVDYWLKNELKSELYKLFDPEFLKRQNLFNSQLIWLWIDEHLAGRENNKGKLWNLFVFQKWYLKKIA